MSEIKENTLLAKLPAVTKTGWPWTEEVDPAIYGGKTHWPKISIVTPSYNQGHFIEETIRSILLQNYPNIEYIIMDGGSSDDSADVIARYAPWLKSWKSEKDKGQADAINKGFALCDGEIFNWLNSDDFLEKNALYHVAINYVKGGTVAGKVFNFYPHSPELNDYTQNKQLEIDQFLALKSTFHQPGIWCDLQVFRKAGLLPVNSTYYFDKIFLARYFLLSKPIIYIENVLVNFRVHLDSKTTLLRNSKLSEVIAHYRQLLQEKEYKAYYPIINQALKHILIPEQILTTWYINNNKKSYAGKIAATITLIIQHPFLLSTRYIYIIIKRIFKNHG